MGEGGRGVYPEIEMGFRDDCKFNIDPPSRSSESRTNRSSIVSHDLIHRAYNN